MSIARKGFLYSMICSAVSVAFCACSPASPKLKPEPVVPSEKVASKNNEAFRRPVVDILFVVDDSGSMLDHQTNVRKNMDAFINEFMKLKLVDYHIGVTSTSIKSNMSYSNTSKALDGVLSKTEYPRGSRTYYNFVSRTTPSALTVLQDNLDLGTTGAGFETILDPIALAFSNKLIGSGGANEAFYRKDAYLVIIIITDAEDSSTSNSPDSLMNFLWNLKSGNKSKVLTYGAIIPSQLGYNVWGCPRDNYGTSYPEALPETIEYFLSLSVNAGQNTVSLCDTNFGPKLVDFSKKIVEVINKPIILSRPPVVPSIKVMFGTQEIPSEPNIGWTFDPIQNAIVFGPNLKLDDKQPEGTGIDVTFDSAYYPGERP